tara:strand:- start:15276 stop:15488 length:213 start_codon:yes stop_codon:yes gene_type:complete
MKQSKNLNLNTRGNNMYNLATRSTYYDIWVDGKFKGFIVVPPNSTVEAEVGKTFYRDVDNYEAIEWGGQS